VTSGLSLNFNQMNSDAQQILQEAAVVAERKMQDTFPELPGKISLK
jgi:division protein CdvB (Snf7/Vps24/ESCRT-III family)